MKKLLALILFLLLPSFAIAQQTQSSVQTQINTNITTNGRNQISGAGLNSVLSTMNSAIFQGPPYVGFYALANGGFGGSQAAATAGQVSVWPGSGGAAVPTSLGSASLVSVPLSLTNGGLGSSQAAATIGQVPVYPGSSGAAVPRYTSAANPVFWGADPTGVANSWSAVIAANTAAGYVVFPPGTYNLGCNNTISSAVPLRWEGAGQGGTILSKSCNGPLITFTNISRIFIGHLALEGNAGSYTGDGLVFGAGTGDLGIDDVQFHAFALAGVKCVGTSGAPLSGLRISRSIFLSNLGNQLDLYYCNDFNIVNNQFGGNGTTTLSGTKFSSSSHGYDGGNSRYSNVNAIIMYDSLYDTFGPGDIFSQSLNEGANLNASAKITFSGVHFHDNSLSSSGSYADLRANSVDKISVTGGSQFYSFSTPVENYSIILDSATTNPIITDNFLFAYTVSPISSAATGPSTICGNLPDIGCTIAGHTGVNCTYSVAPTASLVVVEGIITHC